MGTSSSYEGPAGGGWRDAKRAATRFASTYGSEEGATSAHSVTSAYLLAIGGIANAAARALAARRTAGHLGAFLSRTAAVGLDRALEERGLGQYVGRPAVEVVRALVDALAEPGVTPEEAADRDALIALFDQELLQAASYDDLQLLLIDALDAAGMARLLELFVVEYVYRRLRQELGKQLQNGVRSAADLPMVERDLRDYIVAAVKIQFEDVDVLHLDWEGGDGAKIIEDVFRSAYEQIR